MICLDPNAVIAAMNGRVPCGGDSREPWTNASSPAS